MPQDHRPRSETRQLMIDIVARSERPLTRTEIVNRLNRKKTPHLIDMMDRLVSDGIFSRSIVTFQQRRHRLCLHRCPGTGAEIGNRP